MILQRMMEALLRGKLAFPFFVSIFLSTCAIVVADRSYSSSSFTTKTATTTFMWQSSHRQHHRQSSSRSVLQLLNSIRGGEIIQIDSLKQTKQIIDEANQQGKLVVLDFTAYNCPPCTMIAPYYEELSESEEFIDKVIFLKVNVNDNPPIAQQYDVDGWPTFLFIKNGQVIDSIVGGNAAKLGLYDMVVKYH